MKLCCTGLCRVDNAVRLLHLLLTTLIFYILSASERTELHRAWLVKSGYFFGVLSLTILSSILYLLASLLDPGHLTSLDTTQEPSFKTSNMTLSSPPAKPTVGKDEVLLLESGSASVKVPLEGLPTRESEGSSPLECPPGHLDNEHYCRVCECSRPYRAKHCYSCGCCVRKFDHHCPWLGNCVGERNHRFFWLFLMAEGGLLAWGVAISWSGISLRNPDWFQSNFFLFICLIVTFFSVIIVGLLFLYHSYLMLTGQTTWEQASRGRIPYLKDLPDLSNPFNEGCICNATNFLFHPGLRDWETLYHLR